LFDLEGEFQIIIDHMESKLLDYSEVDSKTRELLFTKYENKILEWSTRYYEELARRTAEQLSNSMTSIEREEEEKQNQ